MVIVIVCLLMRDIPRYSSFFGCHLLPDKIEKFPTALLFCVGCLWIHNDDSSCVALKSCMAGSLECIDLSIYLAEQ